MLVLLVVFHGTALVRRNAAWRSDESLFAAGLKISATNAKLYNNLGHALETRGNLAAALTMYRKGNCRACEGGKAGCILAAAGFSHGWIAE